MLVREVLREKYEKYHDYHDRLLTDPLIKKLGSGLYGTVFSHPTEENVAVKLVPAQDTEYMRFVKSIQHLDNPWLPKIIDVRKIKLADRQAYLVFLQKLSPVTNKRISLAKEYIILTLGEKHQDESWYDELIDEFAEADGFEDVSTGTWEKIAKFSDDENVRELATVLAELGGIDSDSKNLMARPGSPRYEVVFIDPAAPFD